MTSRCSTLKVQDHGIPSRDSYLPWKESMAKVKKVVIPMPPFEPANKLPQTPLGPTCEETSAAPCPLAFLPSTPFCRSGPRFFLLDY